MRNIRFTQTQTDGKHDSYEIDEIKPLLGLSKYTYIYSVSLLFSPNEHRLEQLTLGKRVGG